MTDRLREAAQAALKILEDAETVDLLDAESRAQLEDLRAALAEQEGAEHLEPTAGEAVEALRKAVCALPRYSFLIGPCGGVRCVGDQVGRWIELDAAHALFDLVVVDALCNRGRAESKK